MSNFTFLSEKLPFQYNLILQAENNTCEDPSTAILKMRIFLEKSVEYILQQEHIKFRDDESLSDRLRIEPVEGMRARRIRLG